MAREDLERSCYKDYDHYKEYRDFLVDGEQKASDGLDRAILLISSAALSLIFAFSKSIWGQGELDGILWLKWSWVFLGLALLSVLASLFLSGLIYYFNRKLCDEIMENRSKIITELQNSSEDIPEKIEFLENILLRRSAQFFHYFSPVFLITGVSLVGIFFNINIGGFKNEREASTATETGPVVATTYGQKNTRATSTTTAEIPANSERCIEE